VRWKSVSGQKIRLAGRQVHEAWLVLAGNELVGFYLPGESHFSPLDKHVVITLGDLQ
jgi:hypothetical protein